jgi:glycosyltransferase involved in cell wall biosynthesis
MAKQIKKTEENLRHPEISVIMGAYNGGLYIRPAIDSILEQTFRDLEFIIINDGSLDNTREIIVEYAKKDSRIVFVDNKKNIGLTRSLNEGLKIAKGKFIARMDADDISLPQRLERQVKFFESNKNAGAIGSWYYIINEKGKIIKNCQPPTSIIQIKKAFLNSAPIIHSSLMIRKKALEDVGFYDVEFRYAQDRDLLLRIAKGYELMVVPEYLVEYRNNKDSISLQKEIEQKKFCLKAVKRAIANGTYPKFYYIFTLRYYLSIYLPGPIRNMKNKLFKIIGLRYD